MKYKSATALRHAIQHHLSLISEGGEESVQRLRRHLAFERLLARVFKQPLSPWVLKGGYAIWRLKAIAHAAGIITLGSEGWLCYGTAGAKL